MNSMDFSQSKHAIRCIRLTLFMLLTMSGYGYAQISTPDELLGKWEHEAGPGPDAEKDANWTWEFREDSLMINLYKGHFSKELTYWVSREPYPEGKESNYVYLYMREKNSDHIRCYYLNEISKSKENGSENTYLSVESSLNPRPFVFVKIE